MLTEPGSGSLVHDDRARSESLGDSWRGFVDAGNTTTSPFVMSSIATSRTRRGHLPSLMANPQSISHYGKSG